MGNEGWFRIAYREYRSRRCEVLPEGGKAVVALAGASVVRRDEARGRRATRVRAGRSAAEHRASLRAGTWIIFLILISRKEKGINFIPVNYEL